MALSILERPRKYSLTKYTFTEATASDSFGDVLFTKTSHGIGTEMIYIDSDLDSYNGWWWFVSVDADTFKIKKYQNSTTNVPYINSGTVNYIAGVTQSSSPNGGWHCVHLPIVYKLLSDAWPANSLDTVRAVSSISNDGGYVNLNLSGDIKATGSAAELEFVKITGQNEGIYQIRNWISDSDITIDFPYQTGVTFAGSTVQYYYKDYHARINIYGGLRSGHAWNAQNPYELIATLKIVPDSDNIITVNIANVLKSKINIGKNSSSLDTIPNDIDSWCNFYIDYAEVYTYSNGYSLGTSVGSFTSDISNYEGYAANAKLPFKSVEEGHLGQYIYTNSNHLAKFLTGFETPSIFEDQYFDLSIIINLPSVTETYYILEQRILNGVIVSAIATNLSSYDEGIYRHQITFVGAVDYIRATLFSSTNSQRSESLNIKVEKSCNFEYVDLVWKNYLGGHDYWRFVSGKQLSFQSKKDESKKNVFTNWPKSYGAFADTINMNSSIETNKNYLIRSQYIDHAQARDLISGIESSLLVQIQNAANDRRTVLVSGSNTLEDTDKLKEVQFSIKYTDNSPSQSL